MFDNVTFQIEKFTPDDFNRLVSDWVRQPVQSKNGWYRTDWCNLRINYYPNQNLIRVSNSIHKFYSEEISGLGLTNANDYSFLKVEETIKYFEAAFNRSASQMDLVGRLEYGLNIDTGAIKPFTIIDRYQSIVTTATNPFYVFYNKGGKPYSKFCSFTHYTIKCYDKGKQMGLYGTNLMRYEVVHHSSLRTKQVFGSKSVSVSDLFSIETWNKCFEIISTSYDNIRVIAFPDVDSIEYAKTLCYSLPLLSKDYKTQFQKISNELKKAHEKIKSAPDSLHTEVRNKLSNKYSELVANSSSSKASNYGKNN
ncbi:hypothetical protein [Niabella aquatica]